MMRILSQLKDPLIVIGMHRSGTSILAKILHTCGVYLGADQNIHDESFFFLRKNQWMYNLSHASWDNPSTFKFLLNNSVIRQHVIDELKKQINSNEIKKFLGGFIYYKMKLMKYSPQMWGWKDPRNSYTLPIWLEIFPRAKIIHIVRNGVDVAVSLQRRENKRKNILYNPITSLRCMDLNEAFSLWAEYVEMSISVTQSLKSDQAICIKYEDLVTNPKFYLDHISDFLKVRFSNSELKMITNEIRNDKSYGFINDEYLKSFYIGKKDHPLMKYFEFDRILNK